MEIIIISAWISKAYKEKILLKIAAFKELLIPLKLML